MNEEIKNMTSEQLKALAASMFSPVKICDAYLPSKIHNDIIRKANPTWSEESLKNSYHLHNESQYFLAVEIEKQCCRYEIETQFERSGRRRFPRRYIARCVGGINPLHIKLISGVGATPEDAIKKAKEHAVYFIERNLLALSGEIKPEHVFWHITFADKCRYGKQPDILDYIDAWHKDSKNLELHEYLGFTEKQYARCVEDPLSLTEILCK